MSIRTRSVVAALAACAAATCGAWAAAAVSASPTTGASAAVSLGDSYISGEGGRWRGNSLETSGSRAGTDRAWVASASGGRYDPSLVYLGPSLLNGCHRSDVAEVRSAPLPLSERVNLACSGARTANIFRAASGGVAFRGEAPQADQLRAAARRYRVRLVVLSVGGNDLGFGAIVTDCITAYVARRGPCSRTQQAQLLRRLPAVSTAVAKSLAEIRAVMTAEGYRPTSYQLVLQTYPSFAPRAREARYPETDPKRAAVGRCPFYDADLDWARTSFVPRTSRVWRQAAASQGATLLDLADAFQGREVCARGVRLATDDAPATARTSEWMRFVVAPGEISLGDVFESLHPNAYGQRALGRCLSLVWRRAGAWACRNEPGSPPRAMRLVPERTAQPASR